MRIQKTYKITLIAMLAALSVVGRVSFQFLPNIQPVTTIIIISGFFLGIIPAILLAVLSTYLSNLFLGMGIWTVWQIIAWALIGMGSGLLGKFSVKYPTFLLTAFGLFAGFFYGAVFALTNYFISGKFLGYYLAGLPFDFYHAIGNSFFVVLLYKPLALIFKKYLHK
ncbi:hypothetical protein GCM10011351_05550 [Paraliobacillus quinghaiensis]|uniref:ECF transporter S component n=1 Tax=Paraliobacillus quinghaiensis TaxID=470815 RepID=A0A917WQ85_9BACI|nr:ECF transporter S component [Paraliobacillus quinghaiensis]GGM22630.1 hypothetical protein GCM10011351_05550 [Paraliobacillus quinghaiensis]